MPAWPVTSPRWAPATTWSTSAAAPGWRSARRGAAARRARVWTWRRRCVASRPDGLEPRHHLRRRHGRGTSPAATDRLRWPGRWPRPTTGPMWTRDSPRPGGCSGRTDGFDPARSTSPTLVRRAPPPCGLHVPRQASRSTAACQRTCPRVRPTPARQRLASTAALDRAVTDSSTKVARPGRELHRRRHSGTERASGCDVSADAGRFRTRRQRHRWRLTSTDRGPHHPPRRAAPRRRGGRAAPAPLLHLRDRGWTVVSVIASLGFEGQWDRRRAEAEEAARPGRLRARLPGPAAQPRPRRRPRPRHPPHRHRAAGAS